MLRNICMILISTVIILLCGCAENKPPKIKLIQVLAGDIYQNDSMIIVATANDPEHGRLRYKWSTNGGGLSKSNESSVMWYAPARPGRYKVWLRVDDMFGARDRKSIRLKVLPPSGADTIKGYKPAKGMRVLRAPRRPYGRQTSPSGNNGK